MILDSNTTIKYFKEIAKIPRESGHEEKIAKYLCEFAELRNLEYEKDEYNNVLIKKNNCNKTPLILQVHTDMVCEKEQNKCFDFEEDSIEVMEKNGYLHANGTTLGAIFTVSEETSMLGSINFDTSKLNGKMLLNLDGFEENTILIESAGFYDIILKMHNKFKNIQDNNFNVYEINLTRIKRWSFWF